MVLAEAGEDDILFTEDGLYAANVEKAKSIPTEAIASSFSKYDKVHTPKASTIATVCKMLQCSPTQVVKQVLYQAIYDNGATVIVLISIRGDREVNEVKLQNELTKVAPSYGGKALINLQVADAESQQKWAHSQLPLGYIAPDLDDSYIDPDAKVASKFLRLADHTVTNLQNFVTGANEADYHVVGANWRIQFTLPKVVDLDKAQPGDRAVHDPQQILETARGIEVGHIFQLGTKYSQAMKATFTNEQGEEIPLVMGCYGLGVSRLAQAAVEQSHDKDGIIWNKAIAPYHVMITVPNIADSKQMEVAESLYQALSTAGIEVLLDDRNERAGVKFKDADLVGIPFRVVTGKAISEGKVEIVERASKEAHLVAIASVVQYLQEQLAI
jgi:prolyl-tRNA synthetase